MMLSPGAVEACLEALEPGQFYRSSHGVIFNAARELYLAGKPVDALTLHEALQARGEIAEAGGRERIHELAMLVPATTNVAHYARIVVEKWRSRELLRPLLQAEKSIYEGAASGESLELLERALLDARGRFEQGRQTVVPIQQAMDAFQAKVANPPDDSLGVAVPFRFLTRLQAGRLYVLGGYMKDGKTAMAVQFLRAAANEGKRVGFCTLEMSWRDLTDRIVTTYGVPYHEAQTGRVQPIHRALLSHAVEETSEWNVDIVDDATLNATSIARHQRLGRYELLIIDHLHRFDWDERRDLEKAIQALVNLSKQADVPILLLVQLTSPAQGRPFPRPHMNSVRDTKKIAQEAAQVSFVWRKRDEHDEPTDESLFIVAANRFGPLGSRRIDFVPREVRFVEVIKEAA